MAVSGEMGFSGGFFEGFSEEVPEPMEQAMELDALLFVVEEVLGPDLLTRTYFQCSVDLFW